MDISRRGFLGGAVSAVGCGACAAQPAVSQDAVVEPMRSIVVRGSYDIIVAGGGPAGIAAAVAAARTGAKTLLIEAHGCLGGIWTSGLVGCVLDFDKGALPTRSSGVSTLLAHARGMTAAISATSRNT